MLSFTIDTSCATRGARARRRAHGTSVKPITLLSLYVDVSNVNAGGTSVVARVGDESFSIASRRAVSQYIARGRGNGS